jgi:hypothetical protein
MNIKEMTDQHLENTIAFIERKAELNNNKGIKSKYRYEDLIAEREWRKLKKEQR